MLENGHSVPGWTSVMQTGVAGQLCEAIAAFMIQLPLVWSHSCYSVNVRCPGLTIVDAILVAWKIMKKVLHPIFGTMVTIS